MSHTALLVLAIRVAATVAPGLLRPRLTTESRPKFLGSLALAEQVEGNALVPKYQQNQQLTTADPVKIRDPSNILQPSFRTHELIKPSSSILKPIEKWLILIQHSAYLCSFF